jgi:hypothetical protein
MKRSYEEITKVEFDKLVKTIFPNASLVWEDVPQNLEPPDWYLTANNIRHAVEATSVVDLLSITPDSKLSAINVSATLSEFINDVEKSAKDQGILSGAYTITLCPIPNLSENRKILTDKFLNYISQTKSLQSAAEYTLGYVRQHRVSIKKEHNDKDYVAAGISMGVKWDGEAQEDLSQLVSNAVSAKVHKLRSVSEPIILLILDEYHYSSLADWINVISSCLDRFHFYCICRIAPPDGNAILWAQDLAWLQKQ